MGGSAATVMAFKFALIDRVVERGLVFAGSFRFRRLSLSFRLQRLFGGHVSSKATSDWS